jgi:hypothetical protein
MAAPAQTDISDWTVIDGGIAIRHYFPRDGEYRLKLILPNSSQ